VLAPLFADFFLAADALIRRAGQDMRIFLFFFSALAGCCALVGLLNPDTRNGWWFSTLGVALVVFVWVLAMSKTDKFRIENPTAPLGGAALSVTSLSGPGLT
jgi:peptidoglycan/LPS O-acetylase OafA/YrhL